MGEKYTYGDFHCPWNGCDHESPSKQGLGTHFKRTHRETLREYQRKHRSGDYLCPSCDDIFDTDRGLKVHHARIHGESIAGVEVECTYCGTPKTVVPDRITRYNAHYCNNECRAKDSRKRLDVNCYFCGDEFEIAEWHYNQTEKVFCPGSTCYGEWISENLRGEAHPRWQEGLPRTVPCSNCGKTLERRPERILDRSEEFFCNSGADSCEQEWKQNNTPTGEDHPLYSKIEVECAYCSASVRRKAYYVDIVENIFCKDSACYANWASENLRGEANPNFINGGNNGYGPGWNERKKEQVRKRDGNTCVHCERSEQVHIELYGKRQAVHHIMRPRQVNHPPTHNHPDNLVTLCIDGCHQKWERFSPLRPSS